MMARIPNTMYEFVATVFAYATLEVVMYKPSETMPNRTRTIPTRTPFLISSLIGYCLGYDLRAVYLGTMNAGYNASPCLS